MKGLGVTAALVAALGMGAPAVAQAASLQISSTRILLTAERPIASVQVRNDGDEPMGVQAQLVAWSQDGTGDVYAPTRDVLANPTVFRVPPGGSQVLRFGLQAQAPAGVDRSYRLFLQELPREDAVPGEVQTLLRFSIPVFVPLDGSAPDLDWTLLATPGAAGAITLSNQGTRHIQLTQLRLRDEQGNVVFDQNLSAYVLPQQVQRLPVALPALQAGQTLRVEVASDFDKGVAPATVKVRDARQAAR